MLKFKLVIQVFATWRKADLVNRRKDAKYHDLLNTESEVCLRLLSCPVPSL